MSHLMRCLGLTFSPPEIDQLIQEFDDDNSGTVELEEFLNIFDKMVCSKRSNCDYKTSFRVSDYMREIWIS